MASSTTLLYRFLGIDEGAGATFDKMAAKTTMLGDSSKTALAKVKLLATGFGVAGIGIGIASVKMAMDYQRSMLLIQTQAGATAAEVKSFSKALLAMSGQVAQSPEALATSLYHVYSTGLKGAAALNAVRIAAEGAQVGHADLEATTNALTAAITSGIKGTQNYGQAMGALNAIVGAGDMKLQDLNDALGTGVLSAAKVFNVSLTQAGAALATFGDNNIRGEEAATKLRMAMQDLAQPAAHADKVLAQVGLTGAQLRDSLAKGGLTGALDLLSSHMTAAGITAGKVGPFIEQAFTKKAGVGLGILIDQIGRYKTKLDEVGTGAAGFGSAWQATTKTAAFAFERLKSEAQAAMITLGQHLLPVVTEMATWLGTKLPAAVHVIAPLIRTFAHDVGGVLGPAWHVVAVSLGAAVVAFGAIAKAAAAIKGPLARIATDALVAYAAFKTVGLAVAIFKTIETAIILTRVRLLELSEAFKAVAAGEAAMSMGSFATAAVAVGLAIYELGKGLDHLINGNKQAVATFNNLKNITAEYRDQLQATNGVITDSIRLSVGKQLQDKGLAEKAAAAGISLRQLEDAVMGSDGAFKGLAKSWQATGKPSGDTLTTLAALHIAFRGASGEARALGGSLDSATAKTKSHTAAAGANATATDATAAAQARAAVAARQLATQIATLTSDYQTLVNAEIAQLQSQDAFKTGLLQLSQSVKDNGRTLSQNTLKGLANRDALIALAQNAEKAAEGSKNYKGALIQNVKSLIDFATKAGYSKTQVDALLTQMHLMPKQIRTRLSLDTSGVTQALVNTSSIAASAGHAAGISYQVAFRAAMKIQSPSKVFRYYGQMLIEGLVLGWKDGTAKLKNALTTPVQAALDRLTTVVNNAIKKQKAALAASQTALKDLLKQRATDVANLAGNISSSAGLSSLFGTDANGNPTVTNVNTFLGGQAKMIENFAKDLKWGAAHGLSPALLQEIAGLGAEQGDQVLAQFMSGAASIKNANAAESAIQRYSTSAASNVENAVYAKAVAKDRKAVHDNTVELKKLTAALQKVERNTGKAAALHMTIDAKTGRPVVDKKFIDEILKGIKQAERIAGKKLV